MKIHDRFPRLDRRLLRRLAWVPALLLVCEVTWLVLANLLLVNGTVTRMINRKPEKLVVEWAAAWSLWPGDLRVRGLTLRSNQLAIEWSLTMDEGSARVGLRPLLDDKLVLHGLRGDGAVFHLRRHPRTPEQMAKAALMPPVPWSEYVQAPADWDPRALVLTEQRPPPYPIWAVHLVDAELTGIREIWVEEYRYEGNAFAFGNLFVRPKELLDIEGITIGVGAGPLFFGARRVLDVTNGEIQVTADEIDMVTHRGTDVVPHLGLKVSLNTAVENVRFVDFFLRHFPGLELKSGPGGLRVDLELKDEVMAGAIDVTGQNVTAEYEGNGLRGNYRIDGRIKRWKLGEGSGAEPRPARSALSGVIDVSGTRMSFTDMIASEDGDTAKAAANGWWGNATLTDSTLTLGDGFRLKGRMEAEMRDSSPLVALVEVKRDLPERVAEVFRVPNVKATAVVDFRAGHADIGPLVVKGDELEIRAHLLMRLNRDHKAIVYVKKGSLSMGFEKGGGRTVKVMHPRDWYDEHALSSR